MKYALGYTIGRTGTDANPWKLTHTSDGVSMTFFTRQRARNVHAALVRFFHDGSAPEDATVRSDLRAWLAARDRVFSARGR